MIVYFFCRINADIPIMPWLIIDARNLHFAFWIALDKAIVIGMVCKPLIYLIAGGMNSVCVNIDCNAQLVLAGAGFCYEPFRLLFCVSFGIALCP